MKKFIVLYVVLFSSMTLFSQNQKMPQLGAEFWIEPHYSAAYIDKMIKTLADHKMPVVRIFIGVRDTTLLDNAFASAKKYGEKIQLTLTVPEDPKSEAELERHAAVLKKIVNRYKNEPALETWWLINEPAHGPINNPLAIQNFRKWLQNKYGDINTLNKAWGKNYTTPLKDESKPDLNGFEQIEYSPSWEKSGFYYADYYDWYRFSADNITWILSWIANEVKKYDTKHEVHVNPHNIFGNLVQYDFPSWRKFLTSLGASIHPSWHFGVLKYDQYAMGIAASCEIIKGSSEPNPFWISELQGGNNIWSGSNPLGPEADVIAQWTWTGIGTGAQKVIYWMLTKRTKTGESGDWSLLDFQSNPTDRLEMAGKIAKTMEVEKSFFTGSKAVERKVTILLSRETMITLQRKASKDGREARNANAHIFSALSYYQAFSSLGIPATFKFVEDFDWEHKTAGHLAILPNAVTLSDVFTKRAEDYVTNGNKLIIDGLTGYYDELEVNTPQIKYTFENLCGATFKDIRVKDDIHKIALNGFNDSIPASIWETEILNKTARVFAKSGERVLATRNSFGKGEVVFIPQLVGLGAWLSDNSGFTNWLKSESSAIASQQPIVFTKPTPNVVMSILENKGEYVTIITNGSDKSSEVSLKLNQKLIPRVIFNTDSKNSTLNPSNFELGGKQTVVVRWSLK